MRILSEKDIDLCASMYSEGKSLATIRDFFKIDRKRILEALKLRNIKINKRKTELNIEYFKEINTPEKAYWLGYIAADGCVHRHGWKVSIGSKDADILPKFQKAIGASSPVRYRETFDKRTQKTYSAYTIQICSKQFANFVRSQGINGDKSKNFQFPTHLPKDMWVHFIRGMFDGDGGLIVSKYSTKINIVSTLSGAVFLRDFVKNELGFSVQKLRSVEEQGIHYFEMTKDSVKFLEWIYGPSMEDSRLNRKYSLFLSEKEKYENRQFISYKIRNSKNEIFETDSLQKFCKQHNLDKTSLLVGFNKKREVIRGKSLGWKILTKEISSNKVLA